MEPRNLKYVTDSCCGQLRAGSPEAEVHGVSTDSRRAGPGDLFVALHGERFDGHDYLEAAAACGAVALVVQDDRAPILSGPGAVVSVRNTRQALGRLAARYRRDFDLPCVAVGGSNGKTTTKELLASVLAQRFSTLKSEASFNNEIGVPLTLLNLAPDHGAAVLEVGTNHPGELAPLLWMIQPRLGVITSIGREHLEAFRDLEGVAEEEGWLAELLPYDGRLYVNGDSPCMDRVVKRSRARVVRVGLESGNDWRVREIRLTEQGTIFWVNAPDASLSGEYSIPLLGRHQVVNAVFALAVGAELGLGRTELQRGLRECPPPKMRLQLRETRGIRILNDAYNANTDSVLAALETLRELPCRGRRLAVLGDMAEAGGDTVAAHEEVARRAAQLGVHHLFAVGKMAPVMGSAARAACLDGVTECEEVETAARAVSDYVREGDLVLVKASRATRLERVSDFLEAHPAGVGAVEANAVV